MSRARVDGIALLIVVAISGAGCPGREQAADDAGGDEVAMLEVRSSSPSSTFVRHAQISIVFSEAVDPTTIDLASVEVTVDGAAVERSIQLTDDSTLHVQLAAPPPVDSTVTLALHDTIRGASGIAFVGFTRTWPVPQWLVAKQKGPVSVPSVTTDAAGHPVMAMVDLAGANMVQLARWDADNGTWFPRAGLDFSSWGEWSQVHVAVTAQDMPVVGWTDQHGTCATCWFALKTLRWERPAAAQTHLPSQEPINAGVPFVALHNHHGTMLRALLLGGNSLRICELSAEDTWVPCYPNPFTAIGIDARAFRLASLDNALAAVITTSYSSGIEIHVFQGGTWSTTPAVLGMYRLPLLNDVATDGTALYVAYTASSGVYCDRVDPSTGEVTPLDIVTSDPAYGVNQYGDKVALAVAGDGTLYAAWVVRGVTDSVHLAKRTAVAWEELTLPADPHAGDAIDTVRLEVDADGNPIVIFGGGSSGAPLRTFRSNAL